MQLEVVDSNHHQPENKSDYKSDSSVGNKPEHPSVGGAGELYSKNYMTYMTLTGEFAGDHEEEE